MIDPQNREICPILDEIGAYIRNPLFQNLCSRLQTDYRCKEKIEFSACSRLRDIYRETPEGNGQRWLMIDREDPDVLYNDMLRLIHIRSGKDLSKQKTNH